MVALDATKIDTNLALQFQIVWLAQVMTQQDVLGRDGRVRLQLEDPVPVVLLQPQQRVRSATNVAFDAVEASHAPNIGRVISHERALPARASAAATSPERRAPSIVAGNPVSTQSPARNKFVQRVRAGGRMEFSVGVEAKVARFSFTMRQGGG